MEDERTTQEELFAIRLSDFVHEYRCRFELLLTEVDELFESTLIVIFMNGLPNKLREEVRLFHSTMLEETMERVQEIERKNVLIENKTRT